MSSSYPSLAWPPKNIASGGSWTKDTVDTTPNRTGGTLPKYKTSLSSTNAFYGTGQYVAYANSIYDLNGNDEWPPSGAFDKRDAASAQKTGWHTSQAISTTTTDANPALYLYITLPEHIALQSYTIKARTDCCATQNPSSWDVHGSTDGTNWTLIDTRSGQTGSAVGSSRSYTCNSASYYNMFRFNMKRTSDTVNNQSISLGEIFLFGKS